MALHAGQHAYVLILSCTDSSCRCTYQGHRRNRGSGSRLLVKCSFFQLRPISTLGAGQPSSEIYGPHGGREELRRRWDVLGISWHWRSAGVYGWNEIHECFCRRKRASSQSNTKLCRRFFTGVTCATGNPWTATKLWPIC